MLVLAASGTFLLAVESMSWVEHSASTWPVPVDQSGSVFELLVRACLTLFGADLIFSVTLLL